jgi:DNA polymerase-3 subunit alpha
MEKFAGYGFNKSHSAAYALIAYQTAWLKAHYPAEFMAAVLSADLDNTDKVVTLINECRDLQLDVLPPDVNECAYRFAAQGERAIRYGLGAIKGVGQSAIQDIIEERQRNGPFADLFDFCRRLAPTRVNRRVVEALIRSGALDALGASRAVMMASLTGAMQAADQHVRDRSAGQDDLFGGPDGAASQPCRLVVADEWREADRLAGERDTLGLYLTGHPLARHEAELAFLAQSRLGDLKPSDGKSIVVAGLVVGIRTMSSRRGRMAVVTLDDRTARMEAVVYSDAFQKFRDLIAKDRLLVAEGEVAADEITGGCSMIVESLYDLDAARATFAKQVLIRVTGGQVINGLASSLVEALGPYRDGATPVAIDYRGEGGAGRLHLGRRWWVRPAQGLLDRLSELFGSDAVVIRYR